MEHHITGSTSPKAIRAEPSPEEANMSTDECHITATLREHASSLESVQAQHDSAYRAVQDAHSGLGNAFRTTQNQAFRLSRLEDGADLARYGHNVNNGAINTLLAQNAEVRQVVNDHTDQLQTLEREMEETRERHNYAAAGLVQLCGYTEQIARAVESADSKTADRIDRLEQQVNDLQRHLRSAIANNDEAYEDGFQAGQRADRRARYYRRRESTQGSGTSERAISRGRRYSPYHRRTASRTGSRVQSRMEVRMETRLERWIASWVEETGAAEPALEGDGAQPTTTSAINEQGADDKVTLVDSDEEQSGSDGGDTLIADLEDILAMGDAPYEPPSLAPSAEPSLASSEGPATPGAPNLGSSPYATYSPERLHWAAMESIELIGWTPRPRPNGIYEDMAFYQ